MQQTYQQIAELIEFMVEHKLQRIPLDELAEHTGTSKAHIQKLFTKWVGISPKQFGRYLSLQYAKDLLAAGNTLEKTATLTGLSGTGRLHDLFVDIEAMTPGAFKDNGAALSITYEVYDSPFGRCLVATTDVGVCNVLFGDSDTAVIAELNSRWPEANLTRSKQAAHQAVMNFIHTAQSGEKIKLHLVGTNFQLKVWEALLSIPEGTIASYGTIAKSIDDPALARAVGTAIGDNPIGYLIPCHRVLKSTGEISGYRWGVMRKRAMLEYEALQTDKMGVYQRS